MIYVISINKIPLIAFKSEEACQGYIESKIEKQENDEIDIDEIPLMEF